MKPFRIIHRDLLVSGATSAIIVLISLVPYLKNPEAALNTHYRAQLMFVSTLALPLIDLLFSNVEMKSEAVFIGCAAFVVWIINAIALFLVATLVRMSIKLIRLRWQRSGHVGSESSQV